MGNADPAMCVKGLVIFIGIHIGDTLSLDTKRKGKFFFHCINPNC
jgi:hypothetical protein